MVSRQVQKAESHERNPGWLTIQMSQLNHTPDILRLSFFLDLRLRPPPEDMLIPPLLQRLFILHILPSILIVPRLRMLPAPPRLLRHCILQVRNLSHQHLPLLALLAALGMYPQRIVVQHGMRRQFPQQRACLGPRVHRLDPE